MQDQIILFIFFTGFANWVLCLGSKFEDCTPHDCGNGPKISYPFWVLDKQPDYCGYKNFQITCVKKNPILTISNNYYVIKDIFYSNHSFLVANSAIDDRCPIFKHNLSLDSTPFSLTSDDIYFSLFYYCTTKPSYMLGLSIDCASNDIHYSFAYYKESFKQINYSWTNSCQYSVNVPVDNKYALGEEFVGLLQTNYAEILKMGFLLNWTAQNCSDCNGSDGRCGFIKNEFSCFCKDKTHSRTCDDGARNWVLKAVIASVSAFLGIIAMGMFYFFYQRQRKRKQQASSLLMSRNISSDSYFIKDVDEGKTYHGIHLFTYEELEEATNNFDETKELGDGGFGTVYYGKLRDGRVVAVKRLYENNCRRVEQFMNEVVLLGRLHHQNLVSLYGCTSRHSRELVLVYEYIPNGTVADHLHGNQAKAGSLPWSIRMKIAIETASALTYLHASDVVHRDVKTNNILLDNNFCVKVADFGLSRLFPIDVTHISTAPQGTPGYVDPEYHQCYQLTSKSDVYSFGVVLVELISSQPAVDITRHRHEINLSNMAINKIQNHALHELVDPNLDFQSDFTVRKMVTAVAELAFRCLQNEKDIRPSMVDVLNELKHIQEHYSTLKAEEIDISIDEVVLLRSNQPPVSPDYVITNGISRSTTPSSSV